MKLWSINYASLIKIKLSHFYLSSPFSLCQGAEEGFKVLQKGKDSQYFHCLLCRIKYSVVILKAVIMLEATYPEAFFRACEAACKGSQHFGFADPF